MDVNEYSAIEIRKILQQLFPTRKLVLSQFTFYANRGIIRPTGTTSRRGRRCFRLEDLLPVAAVIALKEEGIPLKNIEALPGIIQRYAAEIFSTHATCRISGVCNNVSLSIADEQLVTLPIDSFLDGTSADSLFWSFDLRRLTNQLLAVINGRIEEIDSQYLERAA
ncbi:MAG: MerR family transcriptional regulator [Deltaproteobacteria bacterium]|nr:MerR family transcriptional regulator [Deltaproteobacteria bacterium]